MLNPECVMPNLFRHLFRAGLFQHLNFVMLNSFQHLFFDFKYFLRDPHGLTSTVLFGVSPNISGK